MVIHLVMKKMARSQRMKKSLKMKIPEGVTRIVLLSVDTVHPYLVQYKYVNIANLNLFNTLLETFHVSIKHFLYFKFLLCNYETNHIVYYNIQSYFAANCDCQFCKGLLYVLIYITIACID